MRQDVIVIIGGSKSQEGLVGSARALGYNTAVFDIRPDAPSGRMSEMFFPITTHNPGLIIEKLQQIEKRAKIAGVVCYSSDLQALTSASIIASAFNLTFPKRELLEVIFNKGQVLKLFSESDIPVPSFLETNDLVEARNFIDRSGSPIIVKPSGSNGGAKGVFLVSKEQIDNVFLTTKRLSGNRKVIVQKFIIGIEYNVSGLVHNNVLSFLPTIRKYTLGKKFGFTHSRYEVTGIQNMNQINRYSLEQTFRKSLKVIHANNYFFNMDVIFTKGNLFVVDFGILLDSKVDRLFSYSGINVYEALLNTLTGKKSFLYNLNPETEIFLKFMYAKKGGRLVINKNFREQNLLVEWNKKPDEAVKKPDSLKDSLGWIITNDKNGTNFDKLERKLFKVV